ncbi:MAG: preprotein translocase subunit YajC [Spirochaetaceae bacterium]|jgi:preprotein translocase subunit YajC|nr:preprotein translocase subunit YajC [Spirochaetaceae bacterium]
MNTFVFSLLMGVSGGSGGTGSPGDIFTTLIPFALIIAIFYFLIIRPQNKKQKETQRMLSALKKGDKIVTIGGIHGVIHSIKEKDSSVVVKIDENTKLEFSRSAISTVVGSAKADKEKIEDKKTESSGDESKAEDETGENPDNN